MNRLHPFKKKNILEKTRPTPHPTVRGSKTPHLGLYLILYIYGENSPASRISENYTQFGAKINTKSAKNRLRMHHLYPFFKKISGGGPRIPTCKRGIPFPHPPPEALRADLMPPPRRVDPLDPSLNRDMSYL